MRNCRGVLCSRMQRIQGCSAQHLLELQYNQDLPIWFLRQQVQTQSDAGLQSMHF